MGGISNFQIEKAFKNIGDDDLNDTFVGVFPSNYMNKFIDHDSMISDKGKYLFSIANLDNSEKPGVHWWNILNIEPKTDIFFLFFWFRWTKLLYRTRWQAHCWEDSARGGEDDENRQ